MKLRIRKLANGFTIYGKDNNGKNTRYPLLFKRKEDAIEVKEEIIRRNQIHHLTVDILNDYRVYRNFLREKDLLLDFTLQVKEQVNSMSTKDIIKELNKRKMK